MKDWATEVANKLDDYLEAMERLRLPEYIRYLDDRRRLLRTHFLAGIAKGVGTAVGFTILGAVIFLLLQHLAQKNLPVIGDFLAQVVEIAQRRLE